jgi:spore coat protein U-like protein
VFGDGTATLTVVGLVPRQTPPAQGSYADFIVATVTF